MSSLSDSEQCDPGTIEDSKLDQLEPVLPRRLYFLWESHQWAVGALDFERDRRDWAQMSEDQRSMLIRTVAPFFAGEASITTAFPSFILSADDEQERAFLTTQLVDEARHMQFFDRVWREVFIPDDQGSGMAIAGARANCNEAFTEVFDRRALQVVNRLRSDQRNTDAKVEAVTIYHIIAEGVLGLTAMHFMLDYFEKLSIFPAITEGLRRVKRDEHRHVAWGTWFLRQQCRQDDHYGHIVQNTLMELLPVASSIIVEGAPAHCDGLDQCEFLDYPSAQISYFALNGLARRLKVIGGATEEIRHFAASGAWRASRVLS